MRAFVYIIGESSTICYDITIDKVRITDVKNGKA